MEEHLWEIAAQVPSLTVLAVIVWMFLKAHREASELVTRIGDECHRHGSLLDDRYKKCVEANTEVMREMVELIGALKHDEFTEKDK